MRRRGLIAASAAASLLALAGLGLGAATDRRDTAFSLGVPNNSVVAALPPGHSLCEGPIDVVQRFDALVFWARPARSLRLSLAAASSGRLLASRRLAPPAAPTGVVVARLSRPGVARGTRISVCLTNSGSRVVLFEGGTATSGSGALRVDGRPVAGGAEIALLFLRPNPPSLLAMLPVVFRRAALFKLTGAGAWTFWLLTALVLSSFALACAAVLSAVKADVPADDENRR